MLDDRRLDGPVCFRLKFAILVRCPGVTIVDEDDMMSDEDSIFNRNAFTDEAMGGDLAVLPDLDPFLDLNESSDLGVISDLAAIEVDEIMDLDVLAELHIVCDTPVVAGFLWSTHNYQCPPDSPEIAVRLQAGEPPAAQRSHRSAVACPFARS